MPFLGKPPTEAGYEELRSILQTYRGLEVDIRYQYVTGRSTRGCPKIARREKATNRQLEFTLHRGVQIIGRCGRCCQRAGQHK